MIVMNTAADAIQMDQRGLLLTCPECGRRNRATYQRLGQIFQCGQCHHPLPQISQPVEVENQQEFDALVAQSALPVLVDFWAPWCRPCLMVAPELVKVAREVAGRVLVAKVNTQDSADLANRFGVSSIPTLALFKGGHEIARQAGAMPAPTILQFIRQITSI